MFPLNRVFLALVFLAASHATSGAEVVDRIVAIINDSIITLSELNAATAIAVDKLDIGEKKDSKKVVEVKGRILENLITQKLVKQASDKAGIDISEREIDNAVDDIKKQNGMNQENLLVALAQSGLTYREYREQLKEQIRQVKFINKEFRSKISIQPEDINDHYRQNIEEFYGPASYRINLLFIPSAGKEVFRLKLKAVQDGIKKGEDFRSMASQYSEGPSSSMGGDMGYMRSGEMDKALEAAAMKLKPGEVSPQINTPEGAYFIQLVDAVPPAPKPLDKVRDQIHEKLFKKVMDERFAFWLAEVKKVAHIEIRL